MRAAAVRDQNSLEVRDHNPDPEAKGQNSQEARDHNPDPAVRGQNSLEFKDLNRSVIRSEAVAVDRRAMRVMTMSTTPAAIHNEEEAVIRSEAAGADLEMKILTQAQYWKIKRSSKM